MEKIVKKQTSIFKKILILLGIIIGLPIVIIIILIAIQPLVDGIDKSKFTSLKSQTMSIFNDIKKASAGVDDWTYEAKCLPELAGDWSTGNYFCNSTIRLDKTITSTTELNSLHEMYFPIISSSKYLTRVGELSRTSIANIAVGSVYQEYKSSDGYKCTYSAKLVQPDVVSTYDAQAHSGSTQAVLILDCTGKANGDWYKG